MTKEAGQSAVLKGLYGTKWLEVPYLVRVRARARARVRVRVRVNVNG